MEDPKDTAAEAADAAVRKAEALLEEQSEEDVFASVPQPRRLPIPKKEAKPDTTAAAEAAPATEAAPESPTPGPADDREDLGEEAMATIRERVIAALREIYDPEIPVNIYDLGLIYDVEVDERARVAIRMTLTSPACPVAGTLPGEVEVKAAAAEGVDAAWVDLVWDPPWGPDSMSEEAKLELGFF